VARSPYTFLAWASLAVGSAALAASGVSASTEPLDAADSDVGIHAAPEFRPAPLDTGCTCAESTWQRASIDAGTAADDDLAPATGDDSSAHADATQSVDDRSAVTAATSAVLSFAPKTSPPVSA
jgi:hypothetical protein